MYSQATYLVALLVGLAGSNAYAGGKIDPNCEPIRVANKLKFEATQHEGVGWLLAGDKPYEKSTFERAGDMDRVTTGDALPRLHRVFIPDRWYDGEPFHSACRVVGQNDVNGISATELAYVRLVDSGSIGKVRQNCRTWLSVRTERALKTDCRSLGPGHIKRYVWWIYYPDEGKRGTEADRPPR